MSSLIKRGGALGGSSVAIDEVGSTHIERNEGVFSRIKRDGGSSGLVFETPVAV